MAAAWCLLAVRVSAQPVGIVDQPCPAPVVPSPALREQIVALLVEPHTVTPAEFERFNKSPELAKLNVDIARANGIAVVLGSIPPSARFGWAPEIAPVPKIRALNEWLQHYAVQHRIHFVDYYTPLAGPAGEFRADLSNDGVHPNRKGYAIMRRLAEASFSEAAR
jgi:hypothetical protein